MDTVIAKESVKKRLQSEEGMSFTDFSYQSPTSGTYHGIIELLPTKATVKCLIKTRMSLHE